MQVHHFVSFDLDRPDGVTESELKRLALQHRDLVAQQSFVVGDLFGSAIDLWGFPVETAEGEVLVGLSSPEVTVDGRWSVQVTLMDSGLFAATRRKRFAELKRVEWAVHNALIEETMGARDLVWDVGEGSSSHTKAQPTP